MLISYNWLRELTETDLNPQELRDRLTMVGLAIDAVAETNGDAVLDVEVPSNRPDCLSHVGIAREVAAIESGSVRLPASKPARVEGRTENFTSVEIVDSDLCPRYAARLVRGVKIGPSPAWLRRRLEEIGQRSINNVADITNYVLHELGQPLHAFDFSRLSENRIVVRPARPGELLKTLDGIERRLDPDMLIIADAVKAVALAGIMGGEDSEISESTVNVLIESAYFDPDSIRLTARRLGMDTEASRRFERGADCENVLRAQTRCVELICDIAGGSATEDAIDKYPHPLPAREVPLRPSRVEGLTSVRVDVQEMIRILNALGFVQNKASGNTLSFIVPSWRADVSREEDLVEEIVRHAGYDRIGSELPPARTSGEYQPAEKKRRDLRRALAAVGFDEAINFSFIDASSAERFQLLPGLALGNDNERFVRLRNPIVEDADLMRPTLLPRLLDSVRHNMNHGIRDVRMFETGRVFASSNSDELPEEREALALIATGSALEEGVAVGSRELDFYDLKGALESGMDAMKLAPVKFSKASVSHLRAGQSAKITLHDGTVVGSLGRLAENVAATYKFRQPVFVAEMDLSSVLAAGERTIQYRPLSRYPSVVRDVTLLVDREVSLDQVLLASESLAPADFREARLIGTYEGANVPEGKRALTLRIEYRADDKTLRDEEVEERHLRLVSFLIDEFHAEQR